MLWISKASQINILTEMRSQQFIATLKTKKAFDKVTSKYTAYTSLNGLQGKVAAKMLILLAIGTLLFVCGILFSFMSITA